MKGTKGYDIMFAKLKNITYVNAEGEEEEEEVERMNSIVASSFHSRKDSETYASFKGLDSDIKVMMSQNRASNANAITANRMTINSKRSTENVSFVGNSILSKHAIGEVAAIDQSEHDNHKPDFLDLDDVHIARKISSAEMMTYYTPKWLGFIGIFASTLASLQLPLFGLLLSKMFFVLMLDITDPDYIDIRNYWVLMFGILTIGMFVSSFVQKLSFGYCSENLVKTIRLKLFEAILYKHIGWFDNKQRAPGVLGSIVQEDIQQLNGLTSEVYSVAIESILGIIVSSGLCLYFSW